MGNHLNDLSASLLLCLGCVASYSPVKQQAQDLPFLMIVEGFVAGYNREKGKRKGAVLGVKGT